jgi:aminopeptidase N
MTITKFTWVAFGFLLVSSCSTTKILIPEPLPMAMQSEDSIEIRNLDTLVVTADEEEPESTVVLQERPLYRSTTTRSFDLLHTRLEVSFLWEKEMVLGRSELTLTPYFYPDSILILDAKNFQIENLTLNGDSRQLAYDYDGALLTIHLDHLYHRGDTLTLKIEYTANPTRGQEGSAAITSDQGLFFINASGEDPAKPQQIWTQGETEFNSRWFPTIDKPNERCTQEIFITVDDRFTTLSNGILKSSTTNEDGTRTDYWVMNLPHAPYLFMLAVGEFAVVKDDWHGKELGYYVEPKYEQDARDIFAHTPEMLTFFSSKTGIEYPWPKYSQIVVRDYVSGAMENTTAVIFGEFVQKHRRELIDNFNDRIVAHELIHHWFGNYVTCESWSNLTLNEGFANYAEYLWLEHKYGKDEAEHHRLQEIQGYLYQASQEMHPLIDFAYSEKERMFDAHSYNKGGLVLHMLRHLVGDDAFYTSLNHYLTTHAFQSVEVHDLRLAFEKVTGLDLNWFFNQWYLEAGHPILDFSFDWNDETSEAMVNVEQKQDPSLPLFKLPTEVEVYFPDQSHRRLEVLIDSRSEQIRIPLPEKPSLIVLDPDRELLAIINEQFTTEQLRQIYNPENSLALRSQALSGLASDKDEESQMIIKQALQDPFWAVRREAMNALNWEETPDLQPLLAKIAREDGHSVVRAEALYLLGDLGADQFKDAIASGINDHDPYTVVAASILALNEVDPEMVVSRLHVLEKETQSDIVAAVSAIYGDSGDTTKLEYFEKHLASVEGLPSLDFYDALEKLLKNTSAGTKMLWMSKFEGIATNRGVSPYTKISATRSMISLLKSAEQKRGLLSTEQIAELRQKIDNVINQEENPQILSIYQSFMGS